MKNLTCIIAMAFLSMACASQQKPDHRKVAPLESGLNIHSLTDCTVAASFSADDFNWRGGFLQATIYSEDIYDAVAVSQLQAGDTLVYQSDPIVVASVVEEHGGLTINGGLEEGGAYLAPNQGGTYRAIVWDDHSVYTELGQAQLMLAQDFMFIDCGENPTDPSDTIRTGQKAYLDELPDYRRDNFYAINTKLVIEKGVITEIQRRWVP